MGIKKPLISIVCITYNQENLIAQTIEGFLNQKTRYGFEIIIGDDCSTDTTGGIISVYGEKHPEIIKIISDDHNVGMIQNFVRCVETAEGKYIAYCDGDDYWIREDKLEKQVDFLETNVEYGLVYTDYHYFYEASNFYIKNADRKFRFPETANFQNLLFYTQICTSTVLFRKSLYDSFKETEDFNLLKTKYCGDTIMWLNFSCNIQFKFLPESTIVRRFYTESGSRSQLVGKMLQYYKDRFDVSIYFANKTKCDKIILNKIHEFYYRQCLVYLNRKNETRKAAEFYELLKTYKLNKLSDRLFRIPYFLFIYDALCKALSRPYYRILLIMRVLSFMKLL